MIEYIATSTVTLGVGARVRLSAEQADARMHCLARVGKGRGGGTFEVLAPIQLKAGEAFGCAGDLPKALAALVNDDSQPAADAGSDAGSGTVDGAAGAGLDLTGAAGDGDTSTGSAP